MTSIFSVIESDIEKAFVQKYASQVNTTTKLLEVYEAFIKATSGIVKDNEFPKWTIMILLSQTLPLMNNALVLLSKGYLRSSEMFIRIAAEGMILGAYFTEFPDVEVEFRTTNYREFFHNHRVENMLKRVEKEGKLLISNKETAKQVKWHKIVFGNLYEESSRFVHQNIDLIYDITIDQINTDKGKANLIIGPQLYPDGVLSMGLRRILNATLFSLVVLGVALNINSDDKEKKIMEDAQKVIEELNKPIHERALI